MAAISEQMSNVTTFSTDIVWEDDIRFMLSLALFAEHLVVGNSRPICSVTISPAFLLMLQPSPTKARDQFWKTSSTFLSLKSTTSKMQQLKKGGDCDESYCCHAAYVFSWILRQQLLQICLKRQFEQVIVYTACLNPWNLQEMQKRPRVYL